MTKNFTKILLTSSCLFLAWVASAQTSTVSGKITDEITGDGLIGVNVFVKGTTTGATTDANGNFTVTISQDPPFTLVISSIGFERQEISITDANTTGLSVSMKESVLLGAEIIISASRKVEKVQEAPASVSVLTAKSMEGSPQVDPLRNLINVPGVQIQQQSAARMNIQMRGASGLFGAGAFPIMDYRSLVGPGVGTFQSDASGLNTIDLQRIEVVRGPGSALYGPGVTAGVIHFITKNPIDYPGTTVELIGGQKSTYGASVRHAQANDDATFGFKINAHFKQGDEFTLKNKNADDALQIAKFKTSIIKAGVTNGTLDATLPGTEVLDINDLDPDGDGNMMQDFWWNAAANATLEFRPSDDLSVTVAGGYNQASAVFYNTTGEGLSQSTEFWSQARMQMGGLFAQVFYVTNDGGSDERPTFLYQGGNTSGIARTQLEGQLQYNFQLPSFLNMDVTVGGDYRNSGQDTENLVYGRNEDDDDYSIIGGYVQTKIPVAEKLDVVLAGRFDQFNFLDEGEFSPRAALVFKADPNHTFRGSFNRASAPNVTLELNIDFPVASPVPGAFDLWLHGNKEATTFNTFNANQTFDVSIPGVPDLPYALVQGGAGIPLAIPFGAVTADVLAGLAAALPASTFALLQGLITAPATAGALNSQFSGTLTPINFFSGEPLTEIEDVPSSSVAITDTYEFGYKGKFMDKFDVTLDVYATKAQNFTLFTNIAPTIALINENIAGDLGAAVQALLEPQILAILTGAGDPNAAANAAGLGAALNGAYNAGGAGFVAAAGALFPTFGVVESDQVPVDDIAHMTLGYRTFGEVNYWGADLGLNFTASNEMSFFFNYSWLNQTDFSGADLGEDASSTNTYSLGVPKTKFRLGAQYAQVDGIRGSISFQHDPAINAVFGQYSGLTDEKNLVDLGVGYDLGNGLTVDLTGTNIFNDKYRAFVNMPIIKRRMIAKVTYNF